MAAMALIYMAARFSTFANFEESLKLYCSQNHKIAYLKESSATVSNLIKKIIASGTTVSTKKV